jgi:hypothetical protein
MIHDIYGVVAIKVKAGAWNVFNFRKGMFFKKRTPVAFSRNPILG